jgi:phage N-6-adenine-methyltransferase
VSLVGFKARNHPQQKANPKVDDRAITPEDFAPLHERFNFTIDAAASKENARLERYWTVEDDALDQSWAGERVWCNPPYSNIEPWVRKAWYGSQHPWPGLIVMLLPANRTEQKWWQTWVEPFRERRLRPVGSNPLRLTVEFLPGRMRMLNLGQDAIKPNERPPFGCCLLIWGSA